MNFQEITEKEYTSFLNNHPLRTFLHTPNIAKMRAVDGWEHIYLGIKNNNKIIAATMLLSRNEFASKKEFYAINNRKKAELENRDDLEIIQTSLFSKDNALKFSDFWIKKLKIDV